MSEYDIKASLDDLEAIGTELVSISDLILEPIEVLNMVLNQRKDEIWYGGASTEYWEIIKNQRDMMSASRDKVKNLAEMIGIYRTELIENEKDISASLQKLK